MMLNERIAAAMTHAKLTPAMLVAKTGATKGAVSFWLNGKTKNLKSETALAIAEATGVRYAWLVNEHGEMLDIHSAKSNTEPLNRLKIKVEDGITLNQALNKLGLVFSALETEKRETLAGLLKLMVSDPANRAYPAMIAQLCNQPNPSNETAAFAGKPQKEHAN